MNFAICTLDGVVYNVQNFLTLPIIDQLRNREHLICPECKGRAFFRQKSRNGRTACFGARPHQIGCLLAVFDGQGANHAEHDSDIFRNSDPRLVIDLNYGAHITTAQITSGDLVVSADSNVAAPGKANITQPKRVTQRRLSSILRVLAKSGNIPSTFQEVVIDSLGGFKASEFFVNFDAIKRTHESHWHGFWGVVVSATFDARTGTLWMNTGGWDEPSICIPIDFVGDLSLRFGLVDAEDLVGANVLIIGMLKTAKNGKKCIKLTHSNLITIG